MLITAAILAILALPILFIGLRGRRVDDHPVCGRCKFDLVGVYPDRRVCPECGSRLGETDGEPGAGEDPDTSDDAPSDARPALSTKKARVRTGNRKRRRPLIALGLIGLLLAASLLGVSVPGVNWDKHKPFALLRLELYWAAASDTTRTGELLDEILSRLDKKKLSEKRLSPIVNQALRIQADPDATWMDPWGEIIERYDSAVGLSDEQLFGYLKQGNSITIEPRLAVRIGDLILVDITHKPGRIGEGRMLNLNIEVDGGSIGLIEIVPGRRMRSVVQRRAYGFSWRSMASLLEPKEPLTEVGTYPLKVDLKLQSLDDGESKIVLAEWIETYEMTIEVVPRDDTDIELFSTDVWQPTETDVTVDSLALRRGVNGGHYLIGKLTIQRSYPFAFRAVAIAGNARYDLGIMTRDWLQPGGDRHFQIYAKDLPDDFNFKTIDIELKYDLDAARKRMNMDQIYPLDMLIKDVPIEYSDPSSEPNK